MAGLGLDSRAIKPAEVVHQVGFYSGFKHGGVERGGHCSCRDVEAHKGQGTVNDDLYGKTTGNEERCDGQEKILGQLLLCVCDGVFQLLSACF